MKGISTPPVKPDNVTLENSASGLRVKPGSIAQGHLKVTSGSITHSGAEAVYVLAGGVYSFWPQVAMSDTTANYQGGWLVTGSGNMQPGVTSYTTELALRTTSATYTMYVFNKYVRASGIDHWIFLKIAKNGQIIGAYEAPDHPCFGNGDDPDIIPHPFVNLKENEQVVLVDNSFLEQIKDRLLNGEHILKIINTEYKVALKSSPIYQPREHVYIDRIGKGKGAVIEEIKNPQRTKYKIQRDKFFKRKLAINHLPDNILFKKLIPKSQKDV